MLSDNEVLLLQLHKISSEIIAGHNLKKSLRKVLENARKLLHFSRVYLFVEDRKKNLIEVQMAVGKYSLIAKKFRWHHSQMGGITYAFKKNKMIILKGILDKRYAKLLPQEEKKLEILTHSSKLARLDSCDIALVPITFRNRTVGLLGADNGQKRLKKLDLEHLEEFASQIGWAIENARLREENQVVMRNLEDAVTRRTQELKELQEQLIHSERLAAIGEMVAGITHEIKNPLTGIIGFTELLREPLKQSKDEQSIQILNGLITSVTHLQSVVKNFLTFAKKGAPQLRKENVSTIIIDAISLSNHPVKKAGVQITTKLAAMEPTTNCDRNQIIQVLTNLIINAAHAIEDNNHARPGIIEISSNQKNNQVIIKVKDNGVGISEENLKDIFKPFFTTKSNAKGTGLGLSVSKRIIEAHHGKIEVLSRLGAGTTFTLKLPAI